MKTQHKIPVGATIFVRTTNEIATVLEQRINNHYYVSYDGDRLDTSTVYEDMIELFDMDATVDKLLNI